MISVEVSSTENPDSDQAHRLASRHFSLSDSVTLADLTKAKAFRDSSTMRMHHHNAYLPYPICGTDLKTLGRYGVGLELYFLLAKQLTIVFLIISAISAWPLYQNYTGYGSGSLFQGQLYSYLTVANQASAEYATDLAAATALVKPLQTRALNLALADGVYTLIFVGFILQYTYVSQRVSKVNQVDNVTAGDYAIEIKGLPRKNIKPEKVKNHFARYGDIAEVYLSRIYNGRLSEYKKRAEISYKLGLRKEIAKQRQEKKTRRGTIRVLENAKVKFDENMNEDDTSANKVHDELPVGRAYIVFDRLEDRMKCIIDYKKSQKCCWRSRKQDARLMFKKKYRLLVKPTTEPSDIIWENLEISHCKRVQRRILAIIITVAIMLASIAIVYTLKSYKASIPNTHDCKTLSINGSLSLGEAETDYTTADQKYCYCKQLTIYDLAKSSDVISFCRQYLEVQSLIAMSKFMGSAGVIIINLILKVILTRLSVFERTSTETKQRVQTMTRVFIALFINTAILTLLANANLQGNYVLDHIPYSQHLFNGNYSDFSREWYFDVGSIITATMIVNALSPHFFNLLIWFPIGCIKRKCCWRCYKSQISLNSVFAGPEFNIATKTSQILTTVFSCFLYSGGMPLLNVICFLTLFSIYWIDKTLILRHYRRPPFYSHALNKRLVTFLPLAVAFHCAFSLYMYGASDIFPSSFTKPAGSAYVVPSPVTIAERIYRYTGIINIILIALACCFMATRFLLTPLKALCRNKLQSIGEEAGVGQGAYHIELDKIKAQGLHSYNIMENQTYRPLIISMNSAAMKIAKIREDKGKKIPVSPVSMDIVEENLDDKNTHNEEHNVLIP